MADSTFVSMELDRFWMAKRISWFEASAFIFETVVVRSMQWFKSTCSEDKLLYREWKSSTDHNRL